MPYTTTVKPTQEPVSLAELKLALRFDGNELDADLTMLAQSAREVAEHESGLLLMPQTVRLELPAWPDDLVIERAPVVSVSSVQYWDGSAWQTIVNTGYVCWQAGTLWRIDPVGGAWPSLGAGAGPRVRVTFVAGYADADDVPACVRRYIIAQAGAWLRSPEAFGPEKLEASPMLKGLLDPVRVYA